MLTNLTIVFPGSVDITILLSVQPGNCPVSENIFQIILKTGIGNLIFFKIPPSLTTIRRSEIGQIASQIGYEIPVHLPYIGLDAFVVMPDHLHGKYAHKSDTVDTLKFRVSRIL